MEIVELADDLIELSLDTWHRTHGARMLPFAGYAMPLQYDDGIVAEHNWTRAHASLFDVSHMGQLLVKGDGAAAALEALLPADLAALKPGRIRYSLLLNDEGGILDDLMITRLLPGRGEPEGFYIVVNGATKHQDIAWIAAHLPEHLDFTHVESRALFALQGPDAADALNEMLPGISCELFFMHAIKRVWHGHELWIGRSGYTGEDGFEISLPTAAVVTFADALLLDNRVKPAGLGARDSLRLEAGLPLYGHDLSLSTDPVSADLTFALSRRRRAEGGYPGAGTIARLLASGPSRQRVGLTIEGRLPAREGAQVFACGEAVGTVTSGGFSPTLGCPIAMAYIGAAHVLPGTPLEIEVRGQRLKATVTPLPFVPHAYHR